MDGRQDVVQYKDELSHWSRPREKGAILGASGSREEPASGRVGPDGSGEPSNSAPSHRHHLAPLGLPS